MHQIISTIQRFWKKTVFFVRCHVYNRLFEKAQNNKECLKLARKSDQNGNYDIDGVSFDGDRIYVNGKIF